MLRPGVTLRLPGSSGLTAGQFLDGLHVRSCRGSRSGVASRRRPAIAILVRALVTLAGSPHRAASAAMVALLLTDQADSVRATRSAGVWLSR